MAGHRYNSHVYNYSFGRHDAVASVLRNGCLEFASEDVNSSDSRSSAHCLFASKCNADTRCYGRNTNNNALASPPLTREAGTASKEWQKCLDHP